MKNVRFIGSLLVLFIGFASTTLPVSAQITIDPVQTITPITNLNPNVKDLIMFQNSSFVQLKWKAPTIAISYIGTPTVAPDDTIYFTFTILAGNGIAAHWPDGTKKWRIAINETILTSPAIDKDGTIYVGTGRAGEPGKLMAFRADGSLKWSFITGDQVASVPIFGADGTIYVASKDGILHALNPVDGTEIWWLDLEVKNQAKLILSPDGTIYVTMGAKSLYAIKPNGTKKWTFPIGGLATSTPTIGLDGTIYVGSDDHKLYAVSPNGTKQWEFDQGSILYAPSVGPDGSVYFGSQDGKLNALLPSGTIKWQFAAGGTVTPPLLGPNGLIYTNSSANKAIYALSPDGTIQWQYKIDTNEILPLFTGHDGTLYEVSTKFADQDEIKSEGLLDMFVLYMYALKVPVTAITINKPTLNLQVEERVSLSAAISPSYASNHKTTWKSSNPNIAAVDSNGQVSALIPGTVTITATSGDGLSTQSKVTVTEGTSPATTTTADTSPFTDTKGHWASPEISMAYERKIASGYPDFSFKPNANITRSEFTVMVMNGLKPNLAGVPLTFTDTNLVEDWAANSVKQAVQLGLVSGYPDGTFRPTANITHAEMISMVVKALGLPLMAGIPTGYADDADIPDWAKPAAVISSKNNLLGGTIGNNFASSMLATRAEAVTAIVRMLNIKP
ncbi:PQQ-binding-like beta-propeller repeat protein [Paenibacillus sp. LMG 31461]|uniref:PQQ-binding-like beta-propeller repeat protein n=1 Tax=Paenibacillus plantarum TaxID=2654975 RepID=A0ABX1XBM0_9BACL|nr:PQQ-binding-like beta-propeller repeat protein [Paenibacillus plantarum]NOU65860.1 PQQ-binding-like beta-propeller repeat protein [Paenibacillus plantarum]